MRGTTAASLSPAGLLHRVVPLLLAVVVSAPSALAVPPDLSLSFSSSVSPSVSPAAAELPFTTRAASAAFGARIGRRTQRFALKQPLVDKRLCGEQHDATLKGQETFLLVERGNCSFAEKAYAAQQLGAKGIIVYNSVDALYGENDELPKSAYDCHYGSAATYADPALMQQCANNHKCRSHRCARLSRSSSPTASTKACCVWDLYTTMGVGKGSSLDAKDIHIPAMFITMADADKIFAAASAIGGSGGGGAGGTGGGGGGVNSAGLEVQITPIKPPPPSFLPSLLLWLLGVATCVGAAVYSNRDLLFDAKTYARLGRREGRHGSSAGSSDIESMELTTGHAVGFIVMASCGLLIMFYVNLYEVLCVFYALAAATSLQVVVAEPLCAYLLGCAKLQHTECFVPRCGVVRLTSVCAFCLAWAVAWTWYFTRFEPYAWILQDLIGVVVCTLFLSTIHFPNTKVASILLCLAFVYDVFFVFISPLLFEESVMVKVASGEGPSKDAEFCEKYPDDPGCRTKSLPMLLLVPRFDGEDGFALLGLGDIVLPGLLLCFALRYDLCTYGKATWRQGYFLWLAVGYAVGLLLADIAVALTGMGQPALLYIVPCTLGLQVYLAYRRGALREMWEGPKTLSRARSQPSQHWEAEYGDEFDDAIDVSL